MGEIEKDLAAGRLSVEPFILQGISNSPRSLQRCAELYSEERYPARITQGFHQRALDHEKDALEDRKDRAEGWAKEQFRAQIKRIEELRDELEIRRDAAKEMLKRRWGGD